MLDRFAALLETRDRFLLTAHENPDGDAVGALVGLGGISPEPRKGLSDCGIPEPAPFLRFLDPEGWIEVFDPKDVHRDLAAWPGTWILLDASEPARLGKMTEAFHASNALKVCLDHHLQEKTMGFDMDFVDSSASASAELVYAMVASRMDLPLPLARALYAGMADDTGNFRFSNSTPRVHRFAADLIERGVDPAEVYQSLYHQGRPQKLKVFGRAFESMRFLVEGRYATTLVTCRDLADCEATLEDLEGLVNKALEIRGVEVSCLMTELPDGRFKVGLRSRGRVDVNAVCRALGGGGHRLASGAKVDGPALEAQTVVDALVVSRIDVDLPTP